MTVRLLIICFFLYSKCLPAQPNCNVYKWAGNTACYKACELYVNSSDFAQGSRESQILLDSVLQICPDFDEGWRTKSIPYLKRGDFLTWRLLIDKAVALNPKEHLGYRGWCRYQFLRDYEGALEDLKQLDSLKAGGDTGYSVNGDYHLQVAKALCYKGLGEKEMAVQLIEKQLSSGSYSPGMYDYLHLAVLYLELDKPQRAIPALEKQEVACPRLSENAYYLALAYRRSGQPEQARPYLEKARELYLAGRHRTDPYDHPMDRIFLSDIDRELAESEK